MTQSVLPLWRRVIFVDWQGVLSRDPFWTSILGSRRHPLRSSLETRLAEVFSPDRPTSHEWMKGLRSSEEIIAAMDLALPRRFRADFLRRRLDVDCQAMRVNVDLFRVLHACRSEALVVIATDNMDCFANAFERARRHSQRCESSRETLGHWAGSCDDIICSSDVGTLKSEDPRSFFGPWLDAYGLSFSDAVLIDDRADNCEAFVAQGGTAFRWAMKRNHVNDVTRSLESWLGMSRGGMIDRSFAGCADCRTLRCDLAHESEGRRRWIRRTTQASSSDQGQMSLGCGEAGRPSRDGDVSYAVHDYERQVGVGLLGA